MKTLEELSQLSNTSPSLPVPHNALHSTAAGTKAVLPYQHGCWKPFPVSLKVPLENYTLQAGLPSSPAEMFT